MLRRMTPPRRRLALDPDELLTRDQIRAEFGIRPNTWSSYVARDEGLRSAAVYISRTPRWPRQVVAARRSIGQGAHAGISEPGDTRARVVACPVPTCRQPKRKGCLTPSGRACLTDHVARFRAAGLLPHLVRVRRPRAV